MNFKPMTCLQLIFLSAMFCSKMCLEIAMKNFFKMELDTNMRDINQRMFSEALIICGSFGKLKNLIEDPELSTKTIFDFDFSNPNDPLYKYNMLLAFHGLSPGPILEDMEYIKNHPLLIMLKNEDERNIAKAFMLRVFRILTINSLGLDWYAPVENEDKHLISAIDRVKVGSGLLPFGALLNHSCVQNVDRLVVDNKFVFFVRRPIQKGEQLFITYG